MKSAKYILMLSAAFLGFTGCLRDDLGDGSDTSSPEITISLASPSSAGFDTRNSDGVDENAIKDLDLLLVKVGGNNNGVVYGRIPIDVNTIVDTDGYRTFKVRVESRYRVGMFDFDVDPNGLYRLVLIANGKVRGRNSDAEVDVVGAALSQSHFLSRIIEYMTAELPGNPDVIPMWGESQETYKLPVGTNPPIGIPTIQMVRSLARVDINLAPAAADVLEVESTWPLNSYLNFRLAPTTGNYSHTTRKVERVSLANTALNTLPKDQDITSWYLPEHDNSTSEDELLFIVKGLYGPEREESYYKLRLLNAGGERVDILRNHRYTADIKNVVGPGYDSEAEALYGNVYLQAEVREWDEVGQNVVFDGSFYLKTSHHNVEVYEGAGYLDLDVETSFPGTGDRSGNTTNDMLPGVRITGMPQFFTATDVTGGVEKSLEDGDGAMTRTIRIAWEAFTSERIDEFNQIRGTQYINIRAGNMRSLLGIHLNTLINYQLPYKEPGSKNRVEATTMMPWLSVPRILTVSHPDGMFRQFTVSVTLPNDDFERNNLYMPWTAEVTGDTDFVKLITSSSSETKSEIYSPQEGSRYNRLLNHSVVYDVGIHDGRIHEAEIVFRTPDDYAYHYEPVVVPVLAGDIRGKANSYMVKPGAEFAFPALSPLEYIYYFKIQYDGVGRNFYPEYKHTKVFLGEEAGCKVVWSDHQGISSSNTSSLNDLRIVSRDSTAYMIVKTNEVEGSNTVVALTSLSREGDLTLGGAQIPVGSEEVIRWSWHLWITDYDPDPSDLAFLIASSHRTAIMDRNLGAFAAEPGANMENLGEMEGLYYQWGRKDPFPRSAVPLWGGAGVSEPVGIGPGDIGTDSRQSVWNPLTPSRNIMWNGTFGDSFLSRVDWYTSVQASWGFEQNGPGYAKAPYDPCPEGWRLPLEIWGHSSLGNYGEAGPRVDEVDNTLNLENQGATVVTGTDPSRWALSYPARGGYFAPTGKRAYTDFDNIADPGKVLIWSGAGAEAINYGVGSPLGNYIYDNNVINLYFGADKDSPSVPGTRHKWNISGSGYAADGLNVRCVAYPYSANS